MQIPVYIISVAKSGHLNQCIALCETIGWAVTSVTQIPGAGRMDGPVARTGKNLKRMYATWKHAPQRVQHDQVVIVAGGAAAEALVYRYRELYGSRLFAVFVGSPKRKEAIFDLAIASLHSSETGQHGFSSAGQTAWINGVLVRKSPAAITARNHTVVLIGGINKAFLLVPETIVRELAVVQDTGMTCVFSRRTPLALERTVRQAFSGRNTEFIDRSDREGYLKAMQGAKRIIVTPDSISMICEACATGQKVEVFKLPCFDQESSTARFVDQYHSLGRIVFLGEVMVRNRDIADDGIEGAFDSARNLFAAWLANSHPHI
jgi:mitochondrial fission protein ELM1